VRIIQLPKVLAIGVGVLRLAASVGGAQRSWIVALDLS